MEIGRTGNDSERVFGHWAREISEDDFSRLTGDPQLTDFKRQKLENDARKNWDLFYKRNKTNFFKDRHWSNVEFPELETLRLGGGTVSLLDAGCGVGNFLIPLVETSSHSTRFYGCDFSQRAVDFLNEHPVFKSSKCRAFQCDLTEPGNLQKGLLQYVSLNIVSLIFVLSSITPEKMETVVKNVFDVLNPGGVVLFRDYGLYDHAMLRFSPGHKISDNFYVRQDGTRVYYFSEDEIRRLFIDCGFQVIECSYVKRETVNIKKGLSVPRIFVHGRFSK